VARGLHWLHTHGIVHGDIRPSKGLFTLARKRPLSPACINQELVIHAIAGEDLKGMFLCFTIIIMVKMHAPTAVLLGDNGRDVKLADAGLSAFMHHDYMAAKSNIGPFIYTVGHSLLNLVAAADESITRAILLACKHHFSIRCQPAPDGVMTPAVWALACRRQRSCMASQGPCLLQPTSTALASCCGSCAQGVTLRLNASACSGQSCTARPSAQHPRCTAAWHMSCHTCFLTWDTAGMPAYNNRVLYSAVPGVASSAHRQWQTSYCSAWTGTQTPGRLQVAIPLAVAVVCISELFWTRHSYRHPSEGRVVSAHYW
jgi:hypothetical protein